VSLYEGIEQISREAPDHRPVVNYVVIACRPSSRGPHGLSARREFKKDQRRPELVRSISPQQERAAVSGAVRGYRRFDRPCHRALRQRVVHHLGRPEFDGVASLGISLVLAVTATMLARESKELLIGEPAGARVLKSIMEIARHQDGVERVNGLLTVHLAPSEIVLALSLEFADG